MSERDGQGQNDAERPGALAHRGAFSVRERGGQGHGDDALVLRVAVRAFVDRPAAKNASSGSILVVATFALAS